MPFDASSAPTAALAPQDRGEPEYGTDRSAVHPPEGYSGPFCRFCGSAPAANATVRGHQGFLVLMRFLKLRGPFCRDCGTAAVRTMTARSMWQGWWGVASMLINPFTMLSNLRAWTVLRRLPAPLPGAPGTPMPTGRPLWRRVEVLGLLLPVLVVGALVRTAGEEPDYPAVRYTPDRVGISSAPSRSAIGKDPAQAKAGDCAHNFGNTSRALVFVVDCGGKYADLKVVGRSSSTDPGACDAFPDSESRLVHEEGPTPYTLCLVALPKPSPTATPSLIA
ncbi:LppU/SCO3897 family protein [Kitasatospora cheerisanensis]|uniref:Toxin-antitoxin system, toxin component n=2 Tax=Kitasatospora TaxID=2063 RepID=A0A066YL78_9ACTN|nr:hypothetical protein [Kitasatospora cheerisanensis]AGZ94225.1 hypothetical protein [Kitasatospora sp. NRRL F-6133]KDN81932.1 hypothetical protein KCH_63710 [Kitasatospora cheerisanensis KCTC 2395]